MRMTQAYKSARPHSRKIQAMPSAVAVSFYSVRMPCVCTQAVQRRSVPMEAHEAGPVQFVGHSRRLNRMAHLVIQNHAIILRWSVSGKASVLSLPSEQGSRGNVNILWDREDRL